VPVLLLLLALLPACSSERAEAEAALDRFLSAWQRGDLEGAAGATDDPTASRPALAGAREGLSATAVALRRQQVRAEDGAGTGRFSVAWTVGGRKDVWQYDSSADLVAAGDGWRVRWEPSVVHPDLAQGQALRATRTMPPRAALLDRAGRPLFVPTAVVTVGVEPRKATDLPALAALLARTLGVDAAEVVADVRAAAPDAFVEVITLRRPDYDRVRPVIRAAPGTVFREGTRLLGPTPRFGQPLLGRVGEATAEVLKESGPAYQAGDQLGTSGLQRALNAQLSGTASVEIAVAATPAGGSGAGTPVKQLATLPGTTGTPVTLTLDRGVQLAAEAALAPLRQNAALVAVRPSTGEVLAVANSASVPYDIAMAGRYPPGSSFKIVTASAIVADGRTTPATPVACPPETLVEGKTFINKDRFDLGTVPLRTALARSCNTTMVQQAQALGADALRSAARQYGVGAGWQLPVDSFSGSFPEPGGATELAADAIGQGKVEMSPLAMALVAATVVKGSVPAPTLLAGRPASPTSPPTPLPPSVAPALRVMTRAVVTEGTATALARMPGGPVGGKTGTAEYGTARPPRSHSWFAGYQGDLAFAVLVEDGASAGKPAVPVAAAFLTALPRPGAG